MNMKKRILMGLLCLAVFPLHAQEKLRLADAIQWALNHNFDLQVVEVDQKASQVRNSPGEAGMLPRLSLDGDLDGAQRNSRQEFVDGRKQEVNRAGSFGYAAAINLSWTLFDGGQMFLRKRWLNEQEQWAELRYRSEVQSVVARVIEAYAGVILAQKSQIAVDTGIALARARMELSQRKYETGTAARVDYLRARVDYNARVSDSLRQVSRLTQARAELNSLMGRDPYTAFEVEDSLKVQPRRQQMKPSVLEAENLSLASYRKQKDMSALQEKMARSGHLPRLDLWGGYAHLLQRSASGFLVFNQQSGPQAGLRLSMPLFNGGAVRRQVKLASLESLRAEILYNQHSTELARDYRVAWQQYQEAYEAYELESQSIEWAQEHLQIEKARFTLGMGTSLESREAEASFVDALIRLFETSYRLKVSEVRLLELENALVESL